jgi:cobalt-zinc-cadmium efflux system outer membrane protein
MSIRQFLVLTTLAAAAQLHAQTLTLPDALAAARNNLDVSLARRALAAAQGDVLAADRSPYPVLSSKLSQIDLQNGIGGGNPLTAKRIDKSIGLDWVWERGNKRALRTQAAQRSASAAQADVEDILTQQMLATSGAFYDLLASQERVEQVSAIERSAVQLAGTAVRRVQAGDLAPQEAARTEIEAQRARSDTQGAMLDQQRAALALAPLIGATGPVTNLKVAGAWPSPAALADAAAGANLSSLVDARADVRAGVERVNAAQAALDTAGAQKKADITWGTSLDHYPGTSTRLLELRMQLPLQGIFGGYNNDGEIARAQAQLAQARDALEKTRRAAMVEMQRLGQELAGTGLRVRSYEQEILPRARKVADNAELAYSKGALSLSDLLDARRTLRTTLLEAIGARADYARAASTWQMRTQPEQLLNAKAAP